ncbi:MAG: hypothetical protein KJO75_10745 [Dactylosporangium sp.]|nr:hypothetical protein [Dactylosporangium sp.]
MIVCGLRVPSTLDQRERTAIQQAGVPFSTLTRERIELGLTDLDDERTAPLAALRRAIAHAS